MNSPEPNKFLEHLRSAIYVLSIVASLILVSLFVLFSRGKVIPNLGVLGDFIGGLLGTIVAILAYYYLKETFFLQKIELEKTRELLVVQQKYLVRQTFETIYFKMLDMIYIMGNDVAFRGARGNDVFAKFYKRMQDYYKSDDTSTLLRVAIEIERQFQIKLYDEKYEVVNQGGVNSNTGEEEDDYVENTVPFLDYDGKERFRQWLREHQWEYCSAIYGLVLSGFDNVIANYYRYIGKTLEFLVSEIHDKDTARKYTGLIQAQLTDVQLMLLLYHAAAEIGMSNDDTKKELIVTITEYGICANINRSDLLNSEHYWFVNM